MPDQPYSPPLDRVKHWAAVLERFERSSLTPFEFFRSEGVPPSSFYSWRRRLRPDMCGPTPSPRPTNASPAAPRPANPLTKPKTASTFVELAVAEPAARAPAGVADALAHRLDALELILRGIRQLVLEHQ